MPVNAGQCRLMPVDAGQCLNIFGTLTKELSKEGSKESVVVISLELSLDNSLAKGPRTLRCCHVGGLSQTDQYKVVQVLYMLVNASRCRSMPVNDGRCRSMPVNAGQCWSAYIRLNFPWTIPWPRAQEPLDVVLFMV